MESLDLNTKNKIKAIQIILKDPYQFFNLTQLNRDVALACIAVAQEGELYTRMSPDLKMNPVVAQIAVENLGELYSYLDESLKRNKEIALTAVSVDGRNYIHLPDEFKTN